MSSPSSPTPSFIGLKNQGATCYLNSLIQTLFLTPEFRQELFSLTPNEVGVSNEEEKKENTNSNKKPKAKRKKIIVELQKLFARLQQDNTNEFPLSTKSLTNAFGWKDGEAMDQHDINELYNLLLDGIESQMPFNKKILNKYYKGKIINIIQCQTCETDSRRYEEFVQLNVILQTMNKSFDALNQSLMASFIDNTEELKDENAYFCAHCNAKVFAKKYCRLIKLPSIIVCNLNRFYYDLQSGEREKINKKFQFPKSLDLSMFVDNEYSEMDKNDISEYDLIGIVVHRGSGATAGHYHAYIRDMNNEVEWKPIKRTKKRKRGRRSRRNNTNTKSKYGGGSQRIRDANMRKKEKKQTAIAILVTILSETESMTRNKLGTEFKNMNDLNDWQHGFQSDLKCTFTEFLKNNHRFKIINPDTRNFSVCLSKDAELNDYESDSDTALREKHKHESESESDVPMEQTPPKTKPKPKPKKKRGRPKKKKGKKKGDLDGFVVSDHDSSDGHRSSDEEYKPVPQTRILRSDKKNKNKSKSPILELCSSSEDEEIDCKENETLTNGSLNVSDGNEPHWFDFNDEDITAVFDSEINDLYDGGDDECPYMVIYRKKCMNTGRWPPEIPAFVQSLLIDEPLDAEEDKQEINIGIIKLNLDTKLVRKRNFESDSDNSDSKTNESDIDNDSEVNNEDSDVQMNGNGKHVTEVIVLYDSDESASKLICKTPDASPKKCENKENISNNTQTNNKKRKFDSISLPKSFSSDTQKLGEEPQKKKRKLQGGSLANLPNPNPSPKRKQKKKRGKKKKKKPAMIAKEYVKSTTLEPIRMTKGSNIKELYIRVSEWADIDMEQLQIAKILSHRRASKRTPNIVNFADKEDHIKLKRIPIKQSDDILVWNKSEGNLAEKELLRRKACIRVQVYILNREYPRSIYINHKQETLTDLYNNINALLSNEEKKVCVGKGRFRDVDTREIYRYCEDKSAEFLCDIGITNDSILRFDSEKAPNMDEIVIRYRLKTKGIKHARDANEEELYVSVDDNIQTLKLLMVSKFNDIESDKFDLRKGRKDWALSTNIGDDERTKIRDLKFEKTQRLILAENNINKNVRKLDVYCKVLPNGTAFDIPKNCLAEMDEKEGRHSDNKNKNIKNKNKNKNKNERNGASIIDKGMNAINLLKRPIGARANTTANNAELSDSQSQSSSEIDGDGDIVMEEDNGKCEQKQNESNIPCDDGLDLYDCNTRILCTLEVEKNWNGLNIKNAIINCDNLQLGTELKEKLSPLHMRVSVLELKPPNQRNTWQILGSNDKKIRNRNGKCIVEFLDSPRKDKAYGMQSSGPSLVFVYKRVINSASGAMYGSRYEIEISQTQRERLDALKGRIIGKCDFLDRDTTEYEDIMLATRDIMSHKWTIMGEREKKVHKKERQCAKKNKKKKMCVYPKPYDRDIIAVLCVKNMNENVSKNIKSDYFETEWDKYYSEKYANELLQKRFDDPDEPQIRINFNNDDSDQENEDQKQENSNTNDNDKDKNENEK